MVGLGLVAGHRRRRERVGNRSRSLRGIVPARRVHARLPVRLAPIDLRWARGGRRHGRRQHRRADGIGKDIRGRHVDRDRSPIGTNRLVGHCLWLPASGNRSPLHHGPRRRKRLGHRHRVRESRSRCAGGCARTGWRTSGGPRTDTPAAGSGGAPAATCNESQTTQPKPAATPMARRVSRLIFWHPGRTAVALLAKESGL